MPSLPSHLRLPGPFARATTIFLSSLNFYRVHLLAFSLIPLIMSGIMYGINTQYEIDYIDCLFNCMSAMTVTGLATVNLSTLSAVQQAILFVQMVIGSPTVVSLVMIAVRRHFFQVRFKHVIQEEQKRRNTFSLSKTMSRVAPSGTPLTALKKRFSMSTTRPDPPKPPSRSASPKPSPDERTSSEQAPTPSTIELKPIQPVERKPTITLQVPPKPHKAKGGKKKHISTSMIKRVDGGGVGLVNPMGWYDGERYGARPTDDSALEVSDPEDLPRPPRRTSSPQYPDEPPSNVNSTAAGLGLEDLKDDKQYPVVATPDRMDSTEETRSPSHTPYAGRQVPEETFPRSRTIAFDDTEDAFRGTGLATGRDGGFPRTATHRTSAIDPLPFSTTTSTFPRTYSLRPTVSRKPETKMSGFGGFPTPFEIAKSLVDKFAPNASRTLTKSLTMPRTATFVGSSSLNRKESALASEGGTEKDVPYITFAATVGRNSRFTGLTEEQMDELGGVEYRALRVLLYIVIGYVLFLPIAAFVIIAPYIGAQGRYDYVFEAQPRLVKIPWFALFQVVSAFSNTGMSLVDLSLVPFQGAYLMNFLIMFLIFAGNTAFPVFLRLTVWTIYKAAPSASKTKETLRFLLDHPRRCYVYLFPSTQTWVLAFVMVSLTLFDWVSFLVLDIGTPTIQAIPVGRRIAAAFVQSAAVRAAGFAIVPLASLAPAVKVLYTVMMYISVYPVALSVRSTNVYEEKSLGLFDDEEEEDYESNEQGAQAVAKYLGWHARRQLAFDIWWLAFALWLICIIEKANLDKAENASWMNIFNIIFELVSGYGTVGLSLGLPYDNYSFSGSFRKLSKLVLIFVMLRGRHRGLPVAIDRAVMLPKDFTAAEEDALDESRARRMSRRGSTAISDDVLASLRRTSMSNMSGMSGPVSGMGGMAGISGTSGPLHQDSTGSDPIARDHYSPNPANSTAPSNPSLRRPSSPTRGTTNSIRSRTGSNQSSSPRPMSSTFQIPNTRTIDRDRDRSDQTDRMERVDPRRSPRAARGGALTPVKESAMSRATTRTEYDRPDRD